MAIPQSYSNLQQFFSVSEQEAPLPPYHRYDPTHQSYFVDPEVSFDDEGEKCHDIVSPLSNFDHFLEIELWCWEVTAEKFWINTSFHQTLLNFCDHIYSGVYWII